MSNYRVRLRRPTTKRRYTIGRYVRVSGAVNRVVKAIRTGVQSYNDKVYIDRKHKSGDWVNVAIITADKETSRKVDLLRDGMLSVLQGDRSFELAELVWEMYFGDLTICPLCLGNGVVAATKGQRPCICPAGRTWNLVASPNLIGVTGVVSTHAK